MEEKKHIPFNAFVAYRIHLLPKQNKSFTFKT